MSFNPQYKATPDTLLEGQRTTGVVDSSGRLLVSGTTSIGAGSAVIGKVDHTSTGIGHGVKTVAAATSWRDGVLLGVGLQFVPDEPI